MKKYVIFQHHHDIDLKFEEKQANQDSIFANQCDSY
jgi:hypothetical protein